MSREGFELNRDFSVFAGTANRPLAAAVAGELDVPLSACAIDRFPDGEVSVRLLEPVCRKEVILIQPTAPPVNDNLMELLALADACRRANAASSYRSRDCRNPELWPFGRENESTTGG